LTPLTIPSFQYSEQTYQYEGPAIIEFFNAPSSTSQAPLGEAFSSSGQPQPKPKCVASIALNPKVKRLTLLVAESGGIYSVQAIPDDEESFPLGQARLLNFSGHPMAFRCNKNQAYTLANGEIRIINPGSNEELLVEPAYQVNNKWEKLSSKRISIYTDCQTSLFFLQSNSSLFRSTDGQILAAIPSFIVRSQVNK
jgi:hypothetical protein